MCNIIQKIITAIKAYNAIIAIYHTLHIIHIIINASTIFQL